MTKNSISFFILVACMCLTGTSCSKDSDEPEIVAELDVSSQSVTLDDNNSASVSVSSNTSWTASTSDSWLVCSPAEGNKNQTITISANSDNTSGAVRTGNVVIKDKSGKKSVTISVKQNVALGPLEVVVDLMVPFTDGFATSVRLGKNVKFWYWLVGTKEFAQAVSDSELINYIKTECSPISSTSNVVWAHNTSDYYWYVPDTDYYFWLIGVDTSGKYGNLAKYSFKTIATNQPLAEVTSVKYETSPKRGWHNKLSLKNGATKYYMLSNQSLDAYNSDDHFFAFQAYYGIIAGKASPIDVTDGFLEYTGNQIVICTWAVNSSGKIGNYSIARGTTSNSARSITTKTDCKIITSEVCPQFLCKKYPQ